MQYQKLRRALKRKGWAEEDKRGDHYFYFVEIDGKVYKATKVSHNAKGQITDDIVSLMAHQMRLTAKELKEFVKCDLARDDWLDRWRERGRGWRFGW